MSTIRQLTRATLRQTQRSSITSPLRTQVQPQGIRPFLTTSPRLAKPQDEEDHFHDRNRLDPQRTESSQSATTDEVATRDAAFDPSKTSPESELGASKEQSKQQGDKRDPLDVSAADKDVSHWRDPMEGGAQKNADREGHSSRESPKKNRARK
ncbi:hypothetical protein BDW69DRAFT_15983 [Aspergillus filifer]